jgi:D5 N terminal like
MDDERRRNGGELNSALAWAVAEALADPDRVEQIRRRSQWTLTDLGNARRLVDAHGQEIRHVPELGCWFTWEGTRWESDITGRVMRHAKATVDRIPDEAKDGGDDKRNATILKHWMASQGAGRIRAMVEVASTERGVPVRVSELDSDPWMRWRANATRCSSDGANVTSGAVSCRRCWPMAEQLLVAVAELGNVLHRGDIVRPDHPLAIAEPSFFQPYRPPAPAMADGTPVRPKAVVARESFAAATSSSGAASCMTPSHGSCAERLPSSVGSSHPSSSHEELDHDHRDPSTTRRPPPPWRGGSADAL